ncbi:MAG TPA: 2-succinyl-5-enolpyruvyl-6-hydroxy-3-cyclohexene-1-carboxylic-acid synthase, partial [Polyangiaceae bacterium]|nr:2-succinyl-5-enolpyruvyl-6-hydroxy-3-cyclohexene-1-carboxylic-acid synthase [Polyangiaceae bacterium]
LTEWSRLLLGTLARAGVEHVVLSPGSRSTPFAWAALQEDKLQCHSLWDERVAAFFALGQARLTGRPSLLLCTSGTAAANYFPALIEASLARVPILVLTADRPFELQHSAAPQTIDQLKLFGDAARAFFELGTPDADPSALAGVVRSVAQAVHCACFPEPGPVHLNARARKPLEPSAADDPAARSLRSAVDGLLQRGPTEAAGATVHGGVIRLARACAETARGLIVVGPHSAYQPEAPAEIARLAEITGFPLICEGSSQLRFFAEAAPQALRIDGFEWLLGSERLRERLRPDLLLSFGAPPTSGAYERFLIRGFSGRRFVVAAHGFPDPHGLASELVSASSAHGARDLTALLERRELNDPAARAAFRRAWAEGNGVAWRAVERELSRKSATLSEACAVRAVLDHMPDPCTLVLGNSLPIRDVDAYVPCSARRVRVLSQRGANGIDGLISGAAGAASLTLEPTLVLLGDVSFMHDVGGLAAARESKGPFVIVVIDNDGGRIFEQLPIFAELAHKPELGRFWLTPPEVDFSHAAALFGHGYERLTSAAEIGPAIGRATRQHATSIVHIVVDPSSARDSEARVRADLEQAPDSGE